MDFNDSSFDSQFDDEDSGDDQFFDQFKFDDEPDESSEFVAGQHQEYAPPQAEQAPVQQASRSEEREGGLLQDMMVVFTGGSTNALWIAGMVGTFIIGLLVGWMILGWYVAPIQWVDANASHLRRDLQEDYMRMAIDSYAYAPNVETAQRRLKEFGEGTLAAELLAAIEANPGRQEIQVVKAFQQQLLGNSGVPLPDTSGGTDAGVVPTETAAPNPMFYTLLCVLTLALAAVIVLMVLRRRKSGGPRTAAQAAREHGSSLEATNYEKMGQSSPIAQWMATYLVGDDLFDDSFSIDSPTGEFLGECGVGIADTIGVGEPKRVSAFEVWLFDKNDIQTVTKVMMSSHVFTDDTNRERLSAKGEPVLVKMGEQAVLETEALQMVARVVDMSYGQGALPDDSFFDRVTIELAIWQK